MLGRDSRSRVRSGTGPVYHRRRLNLRDGIGHSDYSHVDVEDVAVHQLAVAARGVAGRFAKAKPGGGMILLRALETAAALVIVLFGAALLTGYVVSERLIGV